MTRSPDGYFNQTYTIEFTVPGDLDGATLGPAIKAPTSVPQRSDPQYLYRPDVVTEDNPDGNLGLIDADYLVSENGPDRLGTRGNRYVPWFWLESPVAGAPGAALEIVDIVDGSVAVQKVIADLSGLTTFYRDTPFLIPQGSMLRISGFTNPGGTPIKIRLHIQYLNDQNLFLAQQAICECEEAGGGGGAGVDDLDLEWGVQNLAGSGANPRYLWPGAGRTIAQPDPIERPAGVSSLLRAILVRQNNPVVAPGVSIRYDVLINGIPSGFVVLAAGDTVGSVVGLASPAAQGADLAVTATRSGGHPTLVGVLVTTLWERT